MRDLELAVDKLVVQQTETNRLLAIIADALVNMDRREELSRLYENARHED